MTGMKLNCMEIVKKNGYKPFWSWLKAYLLTILSTGYLPCLILKHCKSISYPGYKVWLLSVRGRSSVLTANDYVVQEKMAAKVSFTWSVRGTVRITWYWHKPK